MKLHRILIEAVAVALMTIFDAHKQADKVVEKTLKSTRQWGSRDRAFIADTVYGCVRWWRLLRYLGGCEGLSQADIYTIIGVYLVLKNNQNIDFELFKNIDFSTIKNKQAALTDRKIEASIPDWLDEIGEKELGAEKWSTEITALNQTADVIVRCNTLKTTPANLQKQLALEGWATKKHPLSDDALILQKRGAVTATQAYKNGFFEVQDIGSQWIAPFLEVSAGMQVIDACAGAGGKTLHLATLMRNKGRIIALDTEGGKLTELERRAKRNGITIIDTYPITNHQVIRDLEGSADRLLLDVPCSGLGVLRRNPDAKWKLSLDFLNTIRQTQRAILQNYAMMLKKGGKMVYATCSILPSENQDQVRYFLNQNPAFRLEAERCISPAEDGCDGFYMALLRNVEIIK